MIADRYELRGVLGRGGMAEVRDGWDHRLDRAVAIKLLHPTLSGQQDLRRRFDDEARAAAALNHPGIVAVHDRGDHDGAPFIVMERLPGTTLADLISQGPLPPTRVHAMLDDVLGALTVAHGADVLHRDIKPGNILLSPDGETMKVADFGIAKTAGSANTMTGQIIGTMAYMSPERVAGAPASVADDLYAVGVMAYEALTGRRAFPQNNPAALARAIMDTPPPPIAAARPDVGPVLAGVIDRAMARDPQHRFTSAAQMRAAAQGDPRAMTGGVPPAPTARPATRVMTQMGPPMIPPSAPGTVMSPSADYFVPTPQRNPATRRRTVLAAGAIAAAMTVGALAIALGSSSSAPPLESGSTSTPSAPTSAAPPPPLPPKATPVLDQPPPPVDQEQDKGNGKGNGHGRGNGKGNKKG